MIKCLTKAGGRNLNSILFLE